MFKPQNEQGVAVLFAKHAHQAGIEIVEIGTGYPDATIEWGGERYRVEFEYHASSFEKHDHDPRMCDLVVCWENDWSGCLPTIALSTDGWWNLSPGQIKWAKDTEKQVAYWRGRAERAEREVGRLAEELKVVRFKSGVGLTDEIAHNLCEQAAQLDFHDMTLMLFNHDLITAEQAASMIGVRDVRTVRSRAEKLNGVAK